jgi:hypothetical protein
MFGRLFIFLMCYTCHVWCCGFGGWKSVVESYISQIQVVTPGEFLKSSNYWRCQLVLYWYIYIECNLGYIVLISILVLKNLSVPLGMSWGNMHLTCCYYLVFAPYSNTSPAWDLWQCHIYIYIYLPLPVPIPCHLPGKKSAWNLLPVPDLYESF